MIPAPTQPWPVRHVPTRTGYHGRLDPTPDRLPSLEQVLDRDEDAMPDRGQYVDFDHIDFD